MPIDAMALANILRDAARAEILPRFRHLTPSQIQQKTEAIDLVTEADIEAERFIKRAVAQLAPEALFVGEESVAADPTLLDALKDTDFAVVVDPVDGTANFAAGLPLFAVMAAVVEKGETVIGIIYDPMGDDWVMAEKGQGAWLRRPNGKAVQLHVAAPLPLAQMVGTISVAFLSPATKAAVLANLAKVRVAANYRVAGHDYRLLATGNTQFAQFTKLMPWDHLPGALIAQEAGAYVRRLDGSEYRPEHLDGGLLAATSQAAWEEIRAEILTV